MFVYMQTYVEIILVAILVVILFNGSITGLKDFANSVLGKASMVCLIIFISHQFGTNAGLLMAAITIILLNNNVEGFEGQEGIGCIVGSNEDCDDTKTGPFADAKPIGRKKSKKVPDKSPGAPHTAHGRQGNVNGKDRAKNFTKAAKAVEKAAPVKSPVDKKPVDEKKKEEEEEKGADKKKGDKKGFESFSNYTLNNAADYTNLGSTLAAYSTNDNIMSSMRASEYAKTAPGGCALMTNHIDTMRVVNNPRSEGIF